MLNRLKGLLLGQPLSNNELRGEKLNVFWGMPIMASDAISSVAYAVEEILWVLIAVLGTGSYKYLLYTAGGIVLLLVILVVSYRQTIDSYPAGGGSYTVAKENLGEIPGLTACASLIIGYILTVAVSTAAGAAALTSMVPALLPYNVLITLAMILFMTIGNLRGVKESARIFAIPTYVFILSMFVLIITGIIRGHGAEAAAQIQPRTIGMAGDVTLFLIIRAFSAGCSGLTGVEAVSNAIPNFRDPSQKNAKKVLAILAGLVVIIFSGISYLAMLNKAAPSADTTMLSQIVAGVFGGGSVIYYIIQVATAIILVMAANTSYAGLPMLLSLTARDGYAPRQFAVRGGRLSFSNGILFLSILAGFLVVAFNGETHRLIPLYAIGVFASFTLSQLGMLRKWLREKSKGWQYKALINGLGFILTLLVFLSVAYSKMLEGAWISVICIVLIIIFMKTTHKHYNEVARQIQIDPGTDASVPVSVKSHVIVLVDSLNKASIKAVNYAIGIAGGKNVSAFSVSISEERSIQLKEMWEKQNMQIPLTVKYSEYRDISGTLMKFIESEEYSYNPGDMMTLVMPQFIVAKTWMRVLHNQTGFMLRQKLLHDHHIAVITVPYVMDMNDKRRRK